MSNRREFMSRVLGGTASLAASDFFPGHVLGANDRIRLGLIGAGGRGKAIFRTALRLPNTEGVAVADVYARRLDEVKRFVPNIQTYTDFRRLLDDKSVDAVLIATPQHLHALHFVPAIQAGKDVYQEKTMAFNPDHARRMRRAWQGSGRIVQVGIQSTSGPAFQKARELATPEQMGKITAIHTHHYRNAPYGGWMRPVPSDCDPQHVDWNGFQGEAPPHDFSGDRVINWRFYWDYSGGNVFENMVHQVGFWYKVLDLKIPRSVTMCGSNYLSPKMEVPDAMDVAMDQQENILFTWNSGFGNHHYGEDGNDFVLGDKGTIARVGSSVRYLAEGGPRHRASNEAAPPPGKNVDLVSDNDDTAQHMQNFLDCVRSRKEPNCPLDLGFRSAIACRMALVSLREGRRVTWDAEREEIVQP